MANDLSLGPTLWWLFTRAQMLGLKMSGYVSRGHPSWLLPDWIWEIPLTLTLWLLRPLPTATAKWSPHHHLWADSWLATNYHQDGALTSRGEQSSSETVWSNRPRLGCSGRCCIRHESYDNVVLFTERAMLLLLKCIWYVFQITGERHNLQIV